VSGCIAGADTTRGQLREAGLTIENEWGVSDVLVEGEEWVCFEAVLEEYAPENGDHR
jgi:hypothetical protein